VRFQVSDDNTNFQHLTDEKGYAIGLYGDDFANLLDVPSGTYFRVVIADSGSPLGSLSIKAIGDVEAVQGLAGERLAPLSRPAGAWQ